MHRKNCSGTSCNFSETFNHEHLNCVGARLCFRGLRLYGQFSPRATNLSSNDLHLEARKYLIEKCLYTCRSVKRSNRQPPALYRLQHFGSVRINAKCPMFTQSFQTG